MQVRTPYAQLTDSSGLHVPKLQLEKIFRSVFGKAKIGGETRVDN